MSASANIKHSHQHHEQNDDDHKDAKTSKNVILKRIICALIIIIIAVTTACLVQVRSGEAIIVTRFGDPSRVLLNPGLNIRWPIPFESIIPVDLRVRTTSSGLQDVGTKDGLRIIIQAYVIWQVDPDADNILRFIRAMPSNMDSEAAKQIRTFTGSALETTASSYNLVNLINTDASKVQLAEFEKHLRAQLEQSLLKTYGIKLVQVGIERLTLPAITLNATVERMSAERETIATERTAEGKRQAAEIRSTAERDARVLVADANVKAADISAKSIVDAAKLYGQAYSEEPQLYIFLRSLDTLNAVINPNTRIILRTDTAPFKALVEGPSSLIAPSNSIQDSKHD